MRYTDDAVSLPLQCGTQWDALAHIFYRGQMYNGHGLEHVTARGATRNGIDRIKTGIVGVKCCWMLRATSTPSGWRLATQFPVTTWKHVPEPRV